MTSSPSSSSDRKYNFTGKVVLITGSSSGIGAACARAFARSGAHVTITGYEEADVLALVQEIQAITGCRPFHLTGSLTQPGFAQSLVQGTIRAYGKLDILINNAGRISARDQLGNEGFMDELEAILALNLVANFRMMHLCAPHLEATKGCIVNTSSISAYTPNQGPAYCTSKAAINMATECVAKELGPKGIRVNSVNPGPIRTSIGRYIGEPDMMFQVDHPEREKTIMRRLGSADEAANVYLFLASEDASYVTGSHYVVDGGFLCQ